jgi:hypothetical protein
MAAERKARIVSTRTGDEIIAGIEDIRNAQLALPSQTEALKTLVRLGLGKWKEREGNPQPR